MAFSESLIPPRPTRTARTSLSYRYAYAFPSFYPLSSPHPLAVRFCVFFNTFVPRYRSHGFRVFPHLPFVSQRAYLSTVPPSVYIVHSQSFSLFYVKDALRRSYYSNFLPFLNIIYV